jgi:hypothetical protein
MKNYWITADDREIPISELTDSHLLNIIEMLEDYAKKKKGLTIEYGGCGCGDNMDVYYDCETIYGQDVYDVFEKHGSYTELIEEKIKRKLFAKGESKWQRKK